MNKFKYNGFTFIPKGSFSDYGINNCFKEISKYISTENQLKMNKFQQKGSLKWNSYDFYKASGDAKADVFQCEETGCLYVPASHELFLFNKSLPVHIKQISIFKLNWTLTMDDQNKEILFSNEDDALSYYNDLKGCNGVTDICLQKLSSDEKNIFSHCEVLHSKQ